MSDNKNAQARTMRAAMALAVLGLTFGFASSADAVSSKVRSACSGDYNRFCPSYPPDSSKARQCMRQAGKRLSKRCLDALVDAGEIKRSKR